VPHKTEKGSRSHAWPNQCSSPSPSSLKYSSIAAFHSATAYLQALAAPIPVNPAVDPIAVIAGWSDLAANVDSFARREGAAYILTSSYALTSEMMYYSTGDVPVIQYNERLRWISFRQPEPNVLSQPGLYLADANRDLSNELTSRFSRVIKIAEVSRARHGKQIQRYVLYRLESPVTPILAGMPLKRMGAAIQQP
jgi:hypothetical protein